MLTERSIINFLIWTGGLILAPYVLTSALWFNYTPALITVALLAVFFMFGVARDRLCILPIVGYSAGGHLNFLPGRLGYSDLGLFGLIVYYVIAYIALRRKNLLTGPLYLFIPVVVFASIVLYHDHDASLRLVGGAREGGRGPLFVLIATVVYFFGVSMNSPSPRFLAFTPVFCVAAQLISAAPYTLTTYFPQLSPYMVLISDNINEGAYAAAMLNSDDIVRNQAQASLAASVVILLLCYFPIFTWWRPNRWWIAMISLLCGGVIIMGGFRSGFFGFALSATLAVWCYSSWRTLWIAPLAALPLIVVISLQNDHFIHLPESAQRTLAFIPANWDPEVIGSTESSNEFRANIKKVYLREYASKSPLLGNGLTYEASDFHNYENLQRHDTPDGYYQTQAFITGKIFHIGWISLYDGVGLIGGVAFVALGGGLVVMTGRMIFTRTADRKSPLFPLKVWLFSASLSNFASFFLVFGDIRSAFPVFCAYAIVATHVQRLEKFGYRRPGTETRPIVFDPERAGLPAPV